VFVTNGKPTMPERSESQMNSEAKVKQIVVRFDNLSYEKIKEYAATEHRGLCDFVRHAALYYIEQLDRLSASSIKSDRRTSNG
jgi:predicted house-cleaning NTP pyrophosphatase (Maf/HAM1 superfamily)